MGNLWVVGVVVALAAIWIVRWLFPSGDQHKISCPFSKDNKNSSSAKSSTSSSSDKHKEDDSSESKSEATANGTSGAAEATAPKRYFTLEQLREFNGEGPDKPIYIGLLGQVYDVSKKRDLYGPNQAYHLFAGREASRALAKMQFDLEEIENQELDDLSFMEKETLGDWETKFAVYNKYPVVGRVVYPQNMTRKQLRVFNGVDNPRQSVYVALNGKIYDVTMNGWQFYGPEGGYKQFAGRDASRALALMSFDPEMLDNPSINDFSEDEKQALGEWERKFQAKYFVVGNVLDD